jgi:ribosomal protein S18 acetylase RimI-like enzyme
MARSGSIGQLVTIRDYKGSDIDAVNALSRELQEIEIPLYDRLKPLAEFEVAHIERSLNDIAKNGGRLFVAICDGLIVGYATLYGNVVSEADTTHHAYSFASVEDLCVTKKFRGRGIGKKLLQECEESARASGQKYLRLSVLGGNSRARHFYAEFGLSEFAVTLEKKL